MVESSSPTGWPPSRSTSSSGARYTDSTTGTALGAVHPGGACPMNRRALLGSRGAMCFRSQRSRRPPIEGRRSCASIIRSPSTFGAIHERRRENRSVAACKLHAHRQGIRDHCCAALLQHSLPQIPGPRRRASRRLAQHRQPERRRIRVDRRCGGGPSVQPQVQRICRGDRGGPEQYLPKNVRHIHEQPVGRVPVSSLRGAPGL